MNHYRIFYTEYRIAEISEHSEDVPAMTAADALTMFGVNHASFPPQLVVVARGMQALDEASAQPRVAGDDGCETKVVPREELRRLVRAINAASGGT